MTDNKKPQDQTTLTPKPPVLSPEQNARRVCLAAAREALASSTAAGAFGKAGGGLPEHRSIVDLLDVARYVETGVGGSNPATITAAAVSAELSHEDATAADEEGGTE